METPKILQAGMMRALPGLFVIALVMAARLGGAFQSLEWWMLDYFLRYRPLEAKDDRIALISIDETDLRQMGAYPTIPTQNLAEIVKTLQRYQPRVIGINIFNNPATPVDDADLYAALGEPDNVIVAEKVLPDQIPALSQFPKNQVGFTDIYLDGDNHLRRMILGTPNPLNLSGNSDYRLSLAIRLAETYLEKIDPNLVLENGLRDEAAMRFGKTELPRFQPNTGGYIGADAGGVQILLNFRNHRSPFLVVPFADIKTGRVKPDQLHDRILILGITDSRIRPPISTQAITSLSNLSGLEVQAHAVSQITSAVLDRRPLLKGWPEGGEYAWIFGWGMLSILLCQLTPSTKQKLLRISVTSVGLFLLSYGLLLGGWWLPVFPNLAAVVLTGITYVFFDRRDRSLKLKLDENQRVIEEKRHIIERTFDIIHNGPLQTLASLLRRLRDREITLEALLLLLEDLDQEVRAIGEHLKQETLSQEESLYLSSGLKLDLHPPIHELFYEVYRNTLDRNFPGFRTIKAKIREFEPIQQALTIEQKRDLCRFLEEALCNVGKHAINVTHLSVTGNHRQGWYRLQISDNGESTTLAKQGVGTSQAFRLATTLKGQFKRESLVPKGVLCELRWPIT